jgi:DNA repair photolyase
MAETGPGGAAPRLVGVAKLAAESRPIEVRNDVDYRAIECRSCLNRQKNPRLPFRFTINPYRGCEFGCAYCYARYTHEFMELRDWRDFERKVFAKTAAPDHLARELARPAVRREPIALGTATDPYQPAERRYGITRRILEVLARHRGLELSIVTKSDLVLRDLDLLRRIDERSTLHVSVTVTTVERDLARLLEPRAPTPEKRLAAVRALREAGITAGVSGAPILPFITDSDASLDALFGAAARAGALYLFTSVLFLMDSAKARYLPFVDEAFPEIAGRFRALYERSAHAPRCYLRPLEARIARIRARYGLPTWRHRQRAGEAATEAVQATFPWGS